MTTPQPPRRLTGVAAGLQPWTPEEDAILRTTFPVGGARAAMEALPGRSADGIYHHARELGVRLRRYWTPENDARLRRLWDAELDLPAIAQRLERTPTAVYVRAKVLGLPLGCPEGWEYLSTAARRAGFDEGQLRRILDAAGATIRRAVTLNLPPRGKLRGTARRLQHIVATQEVDAAVTAWLEAEPLAVAARRVGMEAPALARRLRAVGVQGPGRPKCWWRVRGEDVERALAVPEQGHRGTTATRANGAP